MLVWFSELVGNVDIRSGVCSSWQAMFPLFCVEVSSTGQGRFCVLASQGDVSPRRSSRSNIPRHGKSKRQTKKFNESDSDSDSDNVSYTKECGDPLLCTQSQVPAQRFDTHFETNCSGGRSNADFLTCPCDFTGTKSRGLLVNQLSVWLTVTNKHVHAKKTGHGKAM